MELVTNEDGRVIGVRCQQDGGFFLDNTVYNTGKNIAADLLYHGMIVSARGKRCINDGASYANNDLINEFERQFAQQPEDYLLDGVVLRAKGVEVLNDLTPKDTTEIFEAIPGLFAGGEIVEWSCYTGWSCNSCFSLGRLAGAAAAANEPVE